MNPHTDLDVFPTTVDQPDDGDLVNPAAATLNVPSDGELNRSFYLKNRLMGALACSWAPRVDPGVSVNGAGAFWESFWWILSPGNADKIRISSDNGVTWANVTVGLDALACYDIAFDASGNAVIANDASTTLYDFTASTAVFAHHLTKLTGTVSKPRVRVSGTTWLSFYCDTGGAPYTLRASSSADRSTWTSRDASLPTELQLAGTLVARMGVGGGRFVCAVRSSSTTVKIGSVAASALTAWTGATITTSMTSVTGCSDPIYSAEDAVWMIALWGSTGPSPTTEIWTSTDGGVSWTKVKTISASNFHVVQLANIGHLWVGITGGTGAIGAGVYSLDLGVTWYRIGVQLASATATAMGILAGGGGFIALDSGGGSDGAKVTSVRLGNLGAGALS